VTKQEIMNKWSREKLVKQANLNKIEFPDVRISLREQIRISLREQIRIINEMLIDVATIEERETK